MQIYQNGTWVEESEASIPFNEMGFLYGDSLFETIRIASGRPFRLDKHLERISDGMMVVRMEGSRALEQAAGLLKEFIERNEFRDGLIRFIVTRGTLSGLPWVDEHELNIYLSGRPLSPLPESPAKVVYYQEADYPIMRFNPAIKSGNYLGNLLAKKDANAEGAFEPVFVNRNGLITECAIRNIFFIRDESLLTPATDLGVLPGVVRDTTLELAEDMGLPINEAHIPYTEVTTMDEAFITSTGVGILPVYWDAFESDYVITHQLRQALESFWK